MKKPQLLLVIFFACSVFAKILAQSPVITAINGPTAVCSSPTPPMSFTATAINSPTAYAWTVSSPSAGVVIGNPTSSVASVTFPFTNATYTLYCTATNSAGTSPSASFVVQVFETPSVTFSGANSFCQGSSTNLQASATILMASPTINYFWSPGTGLNTQSGPNVTASPSVNTTYTVIATKGMCSNTAAITVSVLPRPNVGAIPTSTSVCFGSQLSLAGTGANTYTWTGGISNAIPFTATASAFYMVTGTGTNGCTDTSGTQVTVYHTIVNVNTSTSSICQGMSAILSFSGATSFSLNGSSVAGSSVSVSPSVTTIYTVTGSGTLGCMDSQTIAINVATCAGLKEYSPAEKDNLMAYPNPANGSFSLLSTEEETVNIFNETGQLIKKVQLSANAEVKVTGLDRGIYFVISQHSRLKMIIN